MVDAKEIVDRNGIKNAFLKCYSNLYKENYVNMEAIQKYIMENKLPKLNSEDKNLLEVPITIEEIEQAISEMKPGKVPGSDGFMAKFYKVF